MIKKIVSYAILGMGIGSPIFTACLGPGGNDSAGLRDTTAWLAASAVYGMLSLIYEADGLKLPVKVGLHALLCGLISLAVGRFLGYGESLGTLFLGMAPVFILIYGLIWGAMYAADRRRARKLNERLKEKRNDKKER